MKQRLNGRRNGWRSAGSVEAKGRSAIRSIAIIGGCGHVGLPLGMAFAQAGVKVELIDLAADRIEQVTRGEMPFFEAGAAELLPLLVRSGRLRATSDTAGVRRADAVVVTVGTPAGPELDLSGIHRVVHRLRPGQLLILRSTVPVGTTDKLAADLAGAGRNDIDLAYCPERIVQGKSLEELASLPQLIAAVQPSAAERAASLFKRIVNQIIFLKPVEAELAKLFCNAYRYIHFAISNQFYMVAQQHGADFHRVYDALRQDYPRMGSFARPGFAAGPCLVKDTMHLGSNSGGFPLGDAALAINESLPETVANHLASQYALDEMTVGILGMAFKPECDDPRDSLSYKLRDVLRLRCRRVLCTDPFVPDSELVDVADVMEHADLLVVATPHACYREMAFRQPVFDISRTVTAPVGNGGVVRANSPRRKTSANGRLARRNGKLAARKRA